MAKRGQFEAAMAQPEGRRPEACVICETMLPEAIDGTLHKAERIVFERHIASCAACRSELAEAQRGEAWLSLLKSQTLEPPADLLDRVLAVTTGSAARTAEGYAAARAVSTDAGRKAEPVATPVTASGPVAPDRDAVGLPQWDGAAPGEWGLSDGSPRAQGLFAGELAETESFATGERAGWAPVWAMVTQPRLVMTAAMAFFSIALTLNLTGVRLRDLRGSDLTFSAMKRSVADADASAARVFQNNRAVYQMESRLSELRNEDAVHDASPAGRR